MLAGDSPQIKRIYALKKLSTNPSLVPLLRHPTRQCKTERTSVLMSVRWYCYHWKIPTATIWIQLSTRLSILAPRTRRLKISPALTQDSAQATPVSKMYSFPPRSSNPCLQQMWSIHTQPRFSWIAWLAVTRKTWTAFWQRFRAWRYIRTMTLGMLSHDIKDRKYSTFLLLLPKVSTSPPWMRKLVATQTTSWLFWVMNSCFQRPGENGKATETETEMLAWISMGLRR